MSRGSCENLTDNIKSVKPWYKWLPSYAQLSTYNHNTSTFQEVLIFYIFTLLQTTAFSEVMMKAKSICFNKTGHCDKNNFYFGNLGAVTMQRYMVQPPKMGVRG